MPWLILISEGTHRNAYPLPKASFTLGRDPTCQLYLAGASVSRHHATILWDPLGNFVIRDDGSTNGTYVNGERIHREALKDHDTIRVGDYLFLLDLSEKRKLPPASKPKILIPSDSQDLAGATRVLARPDEKVSGLSQRLNRKTLLISFGAAFAFFWIVVLAFAIPYFSKQRRAESSLSNSLTSNLSALSSPQIASTMGLLQGKWTWSPSPEGRAVLYSTMARMDTLRLGAVNKVKDKQKAIEEFRNAWEHGVVVYEPLFERIEQDETQSDMVHFVLEDALTKPTFWDFNSTVVPEKQAVLGMFYTPGITNTLYYVRNPKLASKIPKFNEPEFPWRMGEHGIQYSIAGLPVNLLHDVGKLRWMVLLKINPIVSKLTIHTIEGDLFRNIPREYPLSVFPAEVLAQVLYLDSASAPLQVRVNKALPWDDDPQVVANLITTYFKNILSQKPQTPMEIPSVFTLVSSDTKSK